VSREVDRNLLNRRHLAARSGEALTQGGAYAVRLSGTGRDHLDDGPDCDLAQHIGETLAQTAGLRVVECPITLPAVSVNQYWHARYNNDPANHWLRGICAALSVDLSGATASARQVTWLLTADPWPVRDVAPCLKSILPSGRCTQGIVNASNGRKRHHSFSQAKHFGIKGNLASKAPTAREVCQILRPFQCLGRS
jgi:hypothetical protein